MESNGCSRVGQPFFFVQEQEVGVENDLEQIFEPSFTHPPPICRRSNWHRPRRH